MPKKFDFYITTEDFEEDGKSISRKQVNYKAEIIFYQKNNTVKVTLFKKTYDLTFENDFYFDSSFENQLSFNPKIKDCSFSSSFGSGILRTTTYSGTIKVVEEGL
jgi:hypothetical protein